MCWQGTFRSTSGLVQNYIVHICLVAVTMLGINSALFFPFPVINEDGSVTFGREVTSYKSRGVTSEETDIQMGRRPMWYNLLIVKNSW